MQTLPIPPLKKPQRSCTTTTTSISTSNLLQLPHAVLFHISNFCDTQTKLHLRITCKTLQPIPSFLHIKLEASCVCERKQRVEASQRLSLFWPTVTAVDLDLRQYNRPYCHTSITSIQDVLPPPYVLELSMANALCHWTQLTQLTAPWTEAVADNVAKHCTKLRTLTLTEPPHLPYDCCYTHLNRDRVRNLPRTLRLLASSLSLRVLKLERVRPEAVSPDLHSELGKLTQLQSLAFTHSYIKGDLSTTLASLTNLTNLVLHLTCVPDDDTSLFTTFSPVNLPALKSLDFYVGSNWNPEDIWSMDMSGMFTACTALTHLACIWDLAPDYGSWKHLADLKLEHIHLNKPLLAHLVTLTCLTRLDISAITLEPEELEGPDLHQIRAGQNGAGGGDILNPEGPDSEQHRAAHYMLHSEGGLLSLQHLRLSMLSSSAPLYRLAPHLKLLTAVNATQLASVAHHPTLASLDLPTECFAYNVPGKQALNTLTALTALTVSSGYSWSGAYDCNQSAAPVRLDLPHVGDLTIRERGRGSQCYGLNLLPDLLACVSALTSLQLTAEHGWNAWGAGSVKPGPEILRSLRPALFGLIRLKVLDLLPSMFVLWRGWWEGGARGMGAWVSDVSLEGMEELFVDLAREVPQLRVVYVFRADQCKTGRMINKWDESHLKACCLVREAMAKARQDPRLTYQLLWK